ncbi:CLUMA_CG006447, isoform A [Clunio marinus]|uniref:CLUMA_CG006447, isoform A n=1 Tax=Clunio marinus TaxID=568069 RepID=A0A1J1HX50_9DIPT|nr:CLUMA_CG006447, isoform A [Clunio marinus]
MMNHRDMGIRHQMFLNQLIFGNQFLITRHQSLCQKNLAKLLISIIPFAKVSIDFHKMKAWLRRRKS